MCSQHGPGTYQLHGVTDKEQDWSLRLKLVQSVGTVLSCLTASVTATCRQPCLALTGMMQQHSCCYGVCIQAALISSHRLLTVSQAFAKDLVSQPAASLGLHHIVHNRHIR